MVGTIFDQALKELTPWMFLNVSDRSIQGYSEYIPDGIARNKMDKRTS